MIKCRNIPYVRCMIKCRNIPYVRLTCKLISGDILIVIPLTHGPEYALSDNVWLEVSKGNFNRTI